MGQACPSCVLLYSPIKGYWPLILLGPQVQRELWQEAHQQVFDEMSHRQGGATSKSLDHSRHYLGSIIIWEDSASFFVAQICEVGAKLPVSALDGLCIQNVVKHVSASSVLPI